VLLIYNPNKNRPKCIRRWNSWSEVSSKRKGSHLTAVLKWFPLGFFFFFLLIFRFFKRRQREVVFIFELKRVKYLWAVRLFSRYLAQLLLWVAVTVAEFLHWWQPNNTSAICPWMELALNFNSPFKKIDPRCLYARRFTNQVIWLGKDWWHVYKQRKQVRQPIFIHLVTHFHLVLLIWNPANSPFSMT